MIIIAIYIYGIHLAVLSSISIVCWWWSTYCWICKYAAAAFGWCCYWYLNVYFWSLLLPVLELMLLLQLIDVGVDTSMCSCIDHVMLILLVLYLKMLYVCWYNLACCYWYLYFCFCYWLLPLIDVADYISMFTSVDCYCFIYVLLFLRFWLPYLLFDDGVLSIAETANMLLLLLIEVCIDRTIYTFVHVYCQYWN